jgi:hypothetical protein
MAARLGVLDKTQQDLTLEQRTRQEEAEKMSLDAIHDYLEAAEGAGQTVFAKEHVTFLTAPYFETEYVYGSSVADESGPPRTPSVRGVNKPTRSPLNLTFLPDEFLRTWHPTFLIRHPALMLPSLFRTAQIDIELDGVRRIKKEPYEVETTMRWIRTLHDFYLNHFGKGSQWPLVLDADDVMMHPELMTKYAGLVELDPDKLRFSWDKASQEHVAKLRSAEKSMYSFFNASTGVDKGRMAGSIDITAEAKKWRSEFGEEGGEKLERWVLDAMHDYEYLRARRLTLD